jgi:hypothetical protein
MASLDFDTAVSRLNLSFGARVGRPVVHAGVVALPTALAPTAANLAALERAWRFASDDDRGEEAGR